MSRVSWGVALVAVVGVLAGFQVLTKQAARNRAVEARLADFGAAARERIEPGFVAAGVGYPPRAVVLVADKSARTLTLYSGPSREALRPIRTWPVLGMSGGPGPKLREGDRQVPEGFYRVELLNPHSNYHVSLRLNYPNAFDRARAREEGRDRPGSDIYIHGGSASVGCLAMGDSVAEELFTLAADVGLDAIEVIISPGIATSVPETPPWVAELYRSIATALAAL